MSVWMAIALAVPLWAIVLLLVLAFFRGARICSDDDEDALRTRQNAAGSTIAGAKLPTQPPGPPAPPAPDFRRID